MYLLPLNLSHVVEVSQTLSFEILKQITEIFPKYLLKYFKLKKYCIFNITSRIHAYFPKRNLQIT